MQLDPRALHPTAVVAFDQFPRASCSSILPEDMRAAFQSQFEERELQRNVAIYWKERKRSLKRTAAILTCKTADKVRQARDQVWLITIW